MKLKLLPWRLSIVSLPLGMPCEWAAHSAFHSLTQTPEECSLVCETCVIPEGTAAKHGWRCVAVDGVLDFALTGVLAGLSGTLAQAEISIFAVSTYRTDYILFQECDLDRALASLRRNGYEVA